MYSGYHGVLEQVLQLAQSAVLVAGVLSLDGVLKLSQVALTLPSITHKLTGGETNRSIEKSERGHKTEKYYPTVDFFLLYFRDA